jgi:hypothetical protein
MMDEQPKATRIQSAKGFLENPLGPPTLAQAGIDKNLASLGAEPARYPRRYHRTDRMRQAIDRIENSARWRVPDRNENHGRFKFRARTLVPGWNSKHRMALPRA